MEGNGKWQIAFWVITSICGIWLLTLTSNVVANDRIREAGDRRIEDRINDKIDCFTTIVQSIDRRLTKIEAKLGVQ